MIGQLTLDNFYKVWTDLTAHRTSKIKKKKPSLQFLDCKLKHMSTHFLLQLKHCLSYW